jgi:hypothetical protein
MNLYPMIGPQMFGCAHPAAKSQHIACSPTARVSYGEVKQVVLRPTGSGISGVPVPCHRQPPGQHMTVGPGTFSMPYVATEASRLAPTGNIRGWHYPEAA